jgi:pimeloyl-ACP methyl ester carboxylesterase
MSSQLAGVYKRLKSAPDLVVESIAERDYDYFKDLAPDAATKAVLAPRAYSGILSTPAYQADLGAFRIDASMELPAAQGRTKPGVVVALPKSGNAPYPLVVFQHGGGMHKADLFLVGKPYFASGFAMAGIDMPYHGDRSKEPGKNGSDTDMADFDAPLKSRDNFRQAAADHVALFTGLETLNAALKPLTGHDRTLDQSRVFFIGHSMGALTGAIASGAVQAYLGVGLFAGGALYRQLVSDGIFQVPIKDIFNERTKTEVEVMLALIQTLLDGGDPAAYPSRYEDPSLRPMEALIWECIRDPVVNNPATDFMGGAFGAQLLSPPHHNVYGMAGALPPVSGNYDRGDGAGSAVRLLIHRDYPATAVTALHSWIFYSDPVVHEKTAGCFRARADGGNCKFE